MTPCGTGEGQEHETNDDAGDHGADGERQKAADHPEGRDLPPRLIGGHRHGTSRVCAMVPIVAAAVPGRERRMGDSRCRIGGSGIGEEPKRT